MASPILSTQVEPVYGTGALSNTSLAVAVINSKRGKIFEHVQGNLMGFETLAFKARCKKSNHFPMQARVLHAGFDLAREEVVVAIEAMGREDGDLKASSAEPMFPERSSGTSSP